MPALRRASLRELATSAYELGGAVMEGQLHRRPEDGQWMVGENPLQSFLERFSDQEIYLMVVSLADDRPMPEKVCMTCGTEYAGTECPRCRTARMRLRGG